MRLDAIKKRIFESYKKTGKLNKKEQKYCEKVDWHPVDELPMKEEHIKEMKRRLKGPFIRINSIEELFRG